MLSNAAVGDPKMSGNIAPELPLLDPTFTITVNATLIQLKACVLDRAKKTCFI